MNLIKLWNLKKFRDLRVWGLRNWIRATWAQKMYQGISAELTQTGGHNFLHNHNVNQIKPSNLKTFLDLVGSENFIKPKVQNPSCNFHKHDSFYLVSQVESNQIIKSQKNILVLESGAQKLDMGHSETWGLSGYKSRTLAPIFANGFILSRIISWIQANHRILKIILTLWSGV